MEQVAFNMQMRYESLANFDQGNQGALPQTAFQVLRQEFGVYHECFASPLNVCPGSPDQTFNSLFHDVDKFFGSQKSFFEFWPESGAYEVNPPFDRNSVERTFHHINQVMQAAEEEGMDDKLPLLFIVITPFTTDTADDFLLCETKLRPNAHYFTKGFQHRKTQKHIQDRSTTICFFGNDEAESTWSICDSSVKKLEEAFSKELQLNQGDGYAPRSIGKSSITQISIPDELVGKLIGTKGATVAAIEGRTGCNIQVQASSSCEPKARKGEMRQVLLRGTQAQVNAARAEIEHVIPVNGHSLQQPKSEQPMRSGGGSVDMQDAAEKARVARLKQMPTQAADSLEILPDQTPVASVDAPVAVSKQKVVPHEQKATASGKNGTTTKANAAARAERARARRKKEAAAAAARALRQQEAASAQAELRAAQVQTKPMLPRKDVIAKYGSSLEPCGSPGGGGGSDTASTTISSSYRACFMEFLDNREDHAEDPSRFVGTLMAMPLGTSVTALTLYAACTTVSMHEAKEQIDNAAKQAEARQELETQQQQEEAEMSTAKLKMESAKLEKEAFIKRKNEVALAVARERKRREQEAAQKALAKALEGKQRELEETTAQNTKGGGKGKSKAKGKAKKLTQAALETAAVGSLASDGSKTQLSKKDRKEQEKRAMKAQLALARKQLEARVIYVRGCPLDKMNGLYYPNPSHEGWPRLENDLGHHFFHYKEADPTKEALDGWRMGNIYSPTKDCCSCWIKSHDGSVPTAAQTWTCYVDSVWTESVVTVSVVSEEEGEDMFDEDEAAAEKARSLAAAPSTSSTSEKVL